MKEEYGIWNKRRPGVSGQPCTQGLI